MAKINKFRGSKTVPNTTQYNPKLLPSRISEKDLNTLVYQQGVRVRVYQTLWCPNVKSLDGAEHEMNCVLCKGSGFIDINPIETLSFIQAQEKQYAVNPENIGTQWEEQTVMATFISGVELSYYTKVELLDYTNIYEQLVQRQPTGQNVINAFQPTAYAASTGVVTVPDSLDLDLVRVNDVLIDSIGNRFVILGDIVNTIGAKTVRIAKNKTVSLATGAVINRPNVDRLHFKAFSVNAIYDENGIIYSSDTDFTVDRNGDIEWLSGPGAKKPADKQIYSIHYNTIVAYRSIRALHSNRFGTDNFRTDQLEVIEYPQQWVLKKLFLFRKEDSESGQKLDPNKLFPKD